MRYLRWCAVGGRPARVVLSGRRPMRPHDNAPRGHTRRRSSGSSASAGSSASPRSTARTAQEVGRLGDVVDPEDACPGVHPPRQGGERAREALPRPATRDRPDEVLAREREEHGAPEGEDLVEAAQGRHGLGGRLGEVGPGVEHHLLRGHAPLARDLHAPGQEARDVPRHVAAVEAGLEPLDLGHGARVHEDERGAGGRAHVGEPGVAQAGDVVDDLRPGRHRGPRHLGLVGVDGDGHAASATMRSITGTTRSISSGRRSAAGG